MRKNMKYWAFILFLVAFMVLGVMAQETTPDPLMTETPSITPPLL
jgi:hypothetical protein